MFMKLSASLSLSSLFPLLSFGSKNTAANSTALLRRFICGMTTKLQYRDQRLLPCLVYARNTFRTVRAVLLFTILIMITQQFIGYPIVLAGDFGIQGHVFPIQEENILKVIEARLEKIDLDKLNRELRDKTQKYVENPPAVKGITKATAQDKKVRYYDPTYTNPDDIYNHQGLLIAPKGKRVNPLEFTSLTQPLIFIDGDDDEQVSYALTHKDAKIILVKGSPLKLQRAHKRWVYFDQAGIITNKLGISEVPALVEQEGVMLKITTGGRSD